MQKDYKDLDDLTIEDAKQFIADAKKKREDYLNIADRSWREIEKRNKYGKLYGGNDLERTRRWTRFPLWWSCLKIRQPLTLARLPIPVLKDTQGDDPYGRTACIIGERLTRGILKTFDAFSEFQSAVDDFLVTNFGWGRAYYKKDECIEPEKIRLQLVEQQPLLDEVTQQPVPQPPIFLTPDGQEVPQEQVQQDDLGAYLLTGEKVEVESEEVYFESGLYCNYYFDPDARKYNSGTRLAYEYEYSYREFIKKFGKEAFEKLSIASNEFDSYRKGEKRITVYEYHDKFLKQVRWFADNSLDFFQPIDMPKGDPETITEINDMGEEVEKEVYKLDHSDIYGLSGFFPSVEPMIVNSSSKDFWPVPEFFQLQDLIDEIHQIAGRMMLLTKAIRVRFLFDSSIPELKQLIGETGEGGGLGVPNLEQALMNNKNNLMSLVAYLPIGEMIQGLENMYRAFEQRLNTFYQVTGISDLIRGQTNPDSDKTFGERQMEGKFALNRIEPFQRRTQEWIKDNYQLLMEMGLKLFSDETLDDYITPQTLDPEDKERYVGALELLRSNKRRRFRVEFETDSTIAVNDQWRRKQATDLANTLTKAMESVAKVAETQPELAGTELKVLKHLIGEFSDGKLFIDEIQDSIEQVVQRVSQPKPPQPDEMRMKMQLEREKLQVEMQKVSATTQLEQLKLQANQQIEIAKLQSSERLSAIESQIAQYTAQAEQQLELMKIQASSEKERAILEKEYQKISADIALAQQELALKRDELMVELRKVVDKKEVDQVSLIIDERIASFDNQLKTAQLELEKATSMLDMKERFITEQRLQAEHQIQLNQSKFDGIEKLLDVALKKKELDAPVEVKADKEEKPKKPKKKRSKVIRDKNGEIAEILQEEIE
jgi:hypothetical protein